MKEVLIVGAGPYGVGLANVLQASGVDFALYGRPFELWKEHTFTGQDLRSDAHTSEIYDPQQSFDFKSYVHRTNPERAADILKGRIPTPVFQSYLTFVQENLPYPIHSLFLKNLTPIPQGFAATFEDGSTVTAHRVVLATGIQDHAWLPEDLQALGPDCVIHSWNTKELEALRGKKILVVGAGQAAAESVANLKQANSVSWLVPHEPIFYSEPLNLPVPVFKMILKLSPVFFHLPLWAKTLWGRQYVLPTITPDHRSLWSNPDIPKFSGKTHTWGFKRQGSQIVTKTGESFDQIVACTGYRFHLANFGFLAGALQNSLKQRNGIPLLNRNFESSVAGLHFVGGIAEPTFGPAQRFMMGSVHAARRLGKVLRNRHGAP